MMDLQDGMWIAVVTCVTATVTTIEESAFLEGT
jgi:hypothetical protein